MVSDMKHFLNRYKYNYIPEQQFELDGLQIEVPVRYPRLTAMMIFLPISKKCAEEIIGTRRVKPVSILGGRAVLGITVFDYLDCPVGPYRELAFSIPVTLDSKVVIPLLPLKFDTLFNNFGFFTLLLAMNTERGMLHSRELFGYPTYCSTIDISIEKKEKNIFINVKEKDDKILEINVPKLKEFTVEVKSYKTYFRKDNKIIFVNMDTIAQKARTSRKLDRITIGNHQLVSLLKSLQTENKILEFIYYKNAFEVLHSPLDRGVL